MIDTQQPNLSIRKQSEMFGVNRNRIKPRQSKHTEEDHSIMKKVDEIYMKCQFYGQRKLRLELRDQGFKVGRNRVRRLMRIMGIEALVPKPNKSKPCKVSHIYPYLVSGRE